MDESVSHVVATAHDFVSRGGRNVTCERTVIIPAADVATLYNTPYELVPSPGDRSFVAFESATIYHKGTGSGWTMGGGKDLSVQYDNAVELARCAGTLLTSAYVSYREVARPAPAAASTVQDFTPAVGAGLVLRVLVGNPTGTGGDVVVRVRYYVRPCDCD